jgi:hypothetical protein
LVEAWAEQHSATTATPSKGIGGLVATTNQWPRRSNLACHPRSRATLASFNPCHSRPKRPGRRSTPGGHEEAQRRKRNLYRDVLHLGLVMCYPGRQGGPFSGSLPEGLRQGTILMDKPLLSVLLTIAAVATNTEALHWPLEANTDCWRVPRSLLDEGPSRSIVNEINLEIAKTLGPLSARNQRI